MLLITEMGKKYYGQTKYEKANLFRAGRIREEYYKLLFERIALKSSCFSFSIVDL
jgi:hypothetical protein